MILKQEINSICEVRKKDEIILRFVSIKHQAMKTYGGMEV
jgi:hypothetical protein